MRSFLTTKAVARYFLHAMNLPYAKKVLFLAWAQTKEEIEMQGSLLHGLKELLGNENVIDIPKCTSLYTTLREKEERCQLPKHGYTYWFRLSDNNTVSRGQMEKRILEKEFDLIVVTGMFTEEARSQQRLKKGEFPYSKQILSNYEANEIAFVDGHEDPTKTEEARKSLLKKGVFFRREL